MRGIERVTDDDASRCLARQRVELAGENPEVEEAMTAASGAAASISASIDCLTSRRSGPFSCTKSALATASARLGAKVRLSCTVVVHASASAPMFDTCLRKRSSAPSAGSNAVTVCPAARNPVAQAAPMTPVPMIATLRAAFDETGTASAEVMALMRSPPSCVSAHSRHTHQVTSGPAELLRSPPSRRWHLGRCV